ncbi:Adenylate cyclase [Bibersteinia trehalosi USDA-ARS-USMARC-190]|uniref:Adenylate cyclase n=1 Tax=Bibersteinia trehalosi USDA-ARS-USMARC-190 TaxID=1263832 RepID=W0RC57_BIBTR|nr:class I adenylate cyclase [Bibersteinia trehalosi]AHG86973.1 Adenylate cyclase [Bibersteinia trehalosi USDA-ARS-USMARC-190]
MRELTLEPLPPNVDYSQFSQRLEWAKKRIDALENHRIYNILKNSDESFKQVFCLLPLLLQYNHPLLPAYVENSPKGISHFTLTTIQQEYLLRILGSAEFSKVISDHSFFSSSAAFDGLYVMGSIGSITQTCFSDLDLWLCHSKTFSAQEQFLLQCKLDLIKQWAATLGVEVNFFLMNPQQFKSKTYHNDIGDEHNGSAQHFFLLDEFYRSAIRLAGKRILWLHIEKQGLNYQTLVEQAVENGELNAKDWIDFGDFSALSIGEFFGASLWQLYKGIRSPYKSVIKILLLESYAQTYPETDLISKRFKKLLLSPTGICYHFDPYQAMLEQVTIYLSRQNAFGRLSFLRHCFYIKANEGQTDPCRQKALKQLVNEWHWSDKEVHILNNRRHWKVKQVAAQQKKIVEQLLLSYRNLLQFARKFQIDPNIMPQDADFLMRQLYSAFEHAQGKVELINEKAISNLSEENITFINVGEGSSVKAGWYMLNHAPFAEYDSTKRYVLYQPNLIMSVAWAYFNGLITSTSQIHLVNQGVELPKLCRFINDLRLSFPLKAPKLCRHALDHPNEIRNLVVAINLTRDPTKHINTVTNADIEQLDLFNLSSSKEGVIGSISIIYRNMWNEIITRHFENTNALLKALKLISNKIYLSSAPPQSVKVFSYSERLNDELQQFVFNLVNRCITVKTGTIFQRYQPAVVRMAGKEWQLVFNQQQTLTEIIEDPIDKTNNIIPQEIYTFASEGFLQFFFENNDNATFNVYVLDKDNKVECYYYCQGKKEDKIKTVSRLYAEGLKNKEQNAFGSFNFPQFYQLLHQDRQLFIVPFQSKQHRDFLKVQTNTRAC